MIDKQRIRTIVDLEKYEKIVLFGAGKSIYSTLKLLKNKNINIIGIFDNDPNKWGKKIYTHKIYSPSLIEDIVDTKTAVLISTVSYQYEIAKDLISKYNVKEECIFSYTSEYCELNIYNTKKIIKNYNNISEIIDVLQDEESKKYIKDSIISRLTRNPLYLKKNNNIRDSYTYDNIVLPKKGDHIIDCGAYVGDTAELFLKQLKGQCKIYCIEPFKNSYNQLIENVKSTSYEVECLNYAVSNRKSHEIIRCNEDEITVSANLNNKLGKLINQIKVNKLDDIFKNAKKIDFIKFDIEGEEVNALDGARNIIKKYKPRMVISAYHLVEHFWEIPKIIKEIEPCYKVYAGHQPNAPFEIEYYVTI